MTGSIVLLTTCPTKRAAQSLARSIVREGLAACVTIVPAVESHFVWKGKAEMAREFLLFIKTRARSYRALERHIKTHHPYDLPEIIALPITSGEKRYLRWIDEMTAPRGKR